MRTTLFTLFACLLSSVSLAHKPSDAYITLSANAQGASGYWDIAVVDLDAALGLDSNRNGELTWGEIKQQQAQIVDYASKRLSMSQGALTCPLQLAAPTTVDHSDGTYLRFALTAACVLEKNQAVTLQYSLLRGVDPHHRGIAALNLFGVASTQVLNNQADAQSPSARRSSAFLDFVREGIVHISIGLDHVLFIILMVASAVRPFAFAPRKALWPLVGLITAFTVAHSLTLGLALFGWANVSSRWVEPSIAATVLLCALDVIKPFLRGPRWAYAFGFGLLHGLGLASALTALNLATEQRLLALFGFNVGVEIGQIVIALLAFGALQIIAATKIGVLTTTRFAALPVALVALIWFGERINDTKWLPF